MIFLPKELANQLIKKYSTNDPFEIAAHKNIKTLFWNLHYEIKGFYKYIRRNKFIFINSALPDYCQRFVCAHELGHALLHPKNNTPFMRESTLFSVDKIEVEANRFAVELLLPDEIIYDYKDSNLSIEEIASIFGIPKEVARLKKVEFFKFI